MMQNVHLDPETDEDDLYSGYNDYSPIYDIEELENDAAFQQAVRTSHGRRPPVSENKFFLISKTSLASSIGRPVTGAIQDGVTRPMTAVRAAGFTKAALRGSAFDPLGQSRGPAPPLEVKKKDSPEEKIKQLEKEVNELVEESCIANSCGDLKLALEKAKDAGRKERVLVRLREQATTPENINLDLTYSVTLLFSYLTSYFGLSAVAHTCNPNTLGGQGGRITCARKFAISLCNLVSIYLKISIKFYRMALDQVPSVNKQMSWEAEVGGSPKPEEVKVAVSYDHIIEHQPGLGSSEAMSQQQQKIKFLLFTSELFFFSSILFYQDDPHTNLVTEAIKNDHLRQMECERKAMAEKYIMTSAKLIAPVIETSFAAESDYQSDIPRYGKDFAQASSYADIAVNSDRYNPAALTNKGNTVFANGDYEKAAEFYKEALRNDSSCTEALYNIGLTYEKLNRLDETLDCFLKLHAILRNSAEVLYQIANIYELKENLSQAIEWLRQVVSVVPTDPQVLAKLGELYDREGDKSQAFQYYCESYRYFPCNIEVIEWLGAYYIDTQFWEKAIQYFERASLIQPTQVKWQLMVASCFRRSGNYQKALDTYKDTHRKFPESVECLHFLVRLCTNLGLKDAQEYARKLKRLEKMKEIREQRMKSGRDGSGGSRGKREGSASSDSGQNCSASSKGERLSAKLRTLPGTNEPYESSSNKEIDASYVDPLGPQIERPKTAAKKRIDEDDFADEELGDDLLPE
uniref:Intraflagellar transport 88 n=1 Tax=Aotus nancymaae TaxID=37293 RepID=A0A2K5ENK9_AOTNA